MAPNQCFESLQLPTPGLGNQLSVGVPECADEMHSSPGLNRRLGNDRKIQFIFFKDGGWLKIGFNSYPHLEGIREIIESSDHFAFQNLLLGETKSLKLDNVLAGKF